MKLLSHLISLLPRSTTRPEHNDNLRAGKEKTDVLPLIHWNSMLL